MLVALYNNRTYIVNKVDNKYTLITDQVDKVDNSFSKLLISNGQMYYKQINLSDCKLASLYNLTLKADCNLNLPDTPITWTVEIEQDTIKNNQLKLIYYHGILPDWISDEQTISHQYIDFAKIGQCYAEYTYYKKNNRLFNNGPMHVFAKISIDELVQIVNYVNNI